MVCLIMAILSSVLVSTVMRMSERHIRNNISMLACNYVMCMALAAVFVGDTGLLPTAAEGFTFGMSLGLFSGLLYLGSFMLLQWNIHVNGVILSSTFMKLGVMVPTLMAMVCFHETPKAVQVVGLMMAVCAILLINLEKTSSRVVSGAGLVLLLLVGGGTDATSKVYEELGQAALKDNFLFYTFCAAFLFCFIVCLIRKQKLTAVDVGFGFLIGIPNYFSSRFLLLSLSEVPAVIAYPTYSVASILILTLIGVVLFGEKLSRRQMVSLLLIAAALILLNI